MPDFDRPLAPRGEEAAPRMGAFLAGRGLVPDLILCSTARRTRETHDLAFAALPRPETQFLDAIYHATVPALLAIIRAAPADTRHLMLIGHNPGLQALALKLIGGGDPDGRREIAHKFPSAAIAAMSFDAAGWSAVQPGGGHLLFFMAPRQLPAPLSGSRS